MPAREMTAAVCPECGTRIEGGFSRNLGRCMICLLRVGLEDVEEPGEAFALIADRHGTYKIQRRDDGTPWELGRGAMGVTYRAIDTTLQRPVALKIVDSEWIKRGAEARERFMREARAAAALRHPNVATVYYFGIREENGQCFCAMELVEGETLEMRVRRTGPLDALTTIDIALQVTSALAAAEKQGLVHRDLKPANLMLVEAEPPPLSSSNDNATRASHLSSKNATKASHLLVKIIDFGVAKALTEKPDAMGLTHGGFVGTPAFASPEQFNDARVDVRSDIYSLGATLWYLLTGHRPFEGATIEQIRASQHSQALPIEQLKAACVPSRLVSLLASMLALEPAARPDVRALTSQLQACRAQILDRWKAARRFAVVASLIGIAVVVLLIFSPSYNRTTSQNEALANISEKSIAVLPFENMSDDKANAYFADGVQEEILTTLAKVADLKVVSRTSVMRFRDAEKRDLREIARLLGVTHVLEGSVQRVGNRVRVSAQLTTPESGSHLWADRFDGELADVFGMQSAIAQKIVGRLDAVLSPAEQVALRARPTADTAAYDLYLRAREYQGGARTFEEIEKTVVLLDEAIRRDPNFLAALSLLVQVHMQAYWFHLDRAPERLALATQALEKAAGLQPDAAEVHFGRGVVHYFAERDFARALEELKLARRSLPNDAEILRYIGYIERRQGQWQQAIVTLGQAVTLDPGNLHLASELAGTYHSLRQYAEERRVLSMMLTWQPHDFGALALSGDADFSEKADLARLQSVVSGEAAAGADASSVASRRVFVGLSRRDYRAAEKALSEYRKSEMRGQGFVTPREYYEGRIAKGLGDADRAKTSFERARERAAQTVQRDPGDGKALSVLALIEAALQQKDEAMQTAQRAVQLLPVSTDAVAGATLITHLARVYAEVGEADRAFEVLKEAVVLPHGLHYGDLKLDDRFDRIRADPRFEAIVASLAPK